MAQAAAQANAPPGGPGAAPLINRLRLMPDQPVEGCELCPDVFLLVRTPPYERSNKAARMPRARHTHAARTPHALH